MVSGSGDFLNIGRVVSEHISHPVGINQLDHHFMVAPDKIPFLQFQSDNSGEPIGAAHKRVPQENRQHPDTVAKQFPSGAGFGVGETLDEVAGRRQQ